MERFRDRTHAAGCLAREVAGLDDLGPAPIVLGIPRGGVIVADIVARILGADFDVICVEKVGAPWNAEMAVGAVGEGDVLWIDRRASSPVEPAVLERAVAAERAELAEKLAAIRALWPRAALAGRTAIVVDDGIATGSTARAALLALERAAPARRILAVPVGAPETLAELETVADLVLCPLRPLRFKAVGLWYDHFDQVSATEMIDVFRRRSAPDPRA